MKKSKTSQEKEHVTKYLKENNFVLDQIKQLTFKGEKSGKKWTLNQQNVNFLHDTFGEESLGWIGKTVGVFTEEVKGNTAIRIRGTA